MEVSGQLHATGKNPDTHSVGGCVGPRATPSGVRELSIWKNSNNFSKKFKQLFPMPLRNFNGCFLWWDSPPWARGSSFPRLHDHTQLHITLGRTPLNEWSARRRDLYLTTHNAHNRQTAMVPAWLEPTIPASKRPQIHALDRAATGICNVRVSATILPSSNKNNWSIYQLRKLFIVGRWLWLQ
jgi:hypothetical protein